jgi:predicted dehydrogenase
MKKINCILIGLGNIGINYDIKNSKIQTHAKALISHNAFNLLCGIDNSYLAREKFKKKYKIQAYSNLYKVPYKKADLIIVATPTKTHLKIIKRVKYYYPNSAILLEKPISYNINEAKKILKLCLKNKLFVNYHRLCEPSSLVIKKLIKKYKYIDDQPIEIKVTYNKNIIHNCSHFFNLLNFWLGDILNYKVLFLKRFNFDYRADLLVNYNRANVLYVSDNYLSHTKIDIKLKNKIIRYRKDGEKILLYKILKNKIILQKEIKNNMKFSQLNVYSEINKSFLNKRYSVCTGINAFKTLKDILTILTNKSFS